MPHDYVLCRKVEHYFDKEDEIKEKQAKGTASNTEVEHVKNLKADLKMYVAAMLEPMDNDYDLISFKNF